MEAPFPAAGSMTASAHLTDSLVAFCLDALRAGVPPAALAVARRCLVDSLACAFAAVGEPPIDMLRTLHGATPGEATTIGYGDRVRAADAALVNGTMVSLQLYDDNQIEMRGHPSGPLWPAVLAAAELAGAPLGRALAVFAIGFEVECRFGTLLNPAHYETGWHATSTQGTLAATIATSLLLGLDAGQTAHALGIAASLAAGIRRNFGTMTMSLHSGLAAERGIRAARLARAGFTADPQVFDGPMSFGAVFSREWSAQALGESLAGWGRPFMIENPGPTFKLYPCGRPTLYGVDGALALRERHGLRAADVRRITCDVSYMFPRTLIHARPANGFQGKTSLEYCVASTLLHGRPTLATFEDDAVRRPDVTDLIGRIAVRVPPELSEDVPAVRKAPFDQPVTLRAETSDGRTLVETIRHHRGSPQNPAAEEDLRHKFVDCAGRHLGPPRVENILDTVHRDDATVASLMQALRIDRASPAD